jgi:hypothetical protein
MFMNSHLGLLSLENLANFAVLAAGLNQALGTAGGIIQAIALVAVFGGIIGAVVSALSEKHLAGVKTSLVIAAIGGVGLVDCNFVLRSGRGSDQHPVATS